MGGFSLSAFSALAKSCATGGGSNFSGSVPAASLVDGVIAMEWQVWHSAQVWQWLFGAALTSEAARSVQPPTFAAGMPSRGSACAA